MRVSKYKALSITLICCAIFNLARAACRAEENIRTDYGELVDQPLGLAIAVSTILDWWKERAIAFPDYKISPPDGGWRELQAHSASSQQKKSYTVLSLDGRSNWRATVQLDCPSSWEIEMATQVDCTIIVNVSVDPSTGAARICKVRFSYRAVLPYLILK